AIMKVAEAVRATKTDPATYMLAVKYIDTLRDITSGKDNKVIYMPYEATSVLSSIGSIRGLFADNQLPPKV
ncbi:MAG: SPFH/Band 7/PHB domain protein, partial [Muribaculaceae bacterium]|nr:SPFH/Band 7/PHB domain protein [Muribaculaceae bacterium]